MVLGPGYTTDQSRGTGGGQEGDNRSNRKRRADQDHRTRRPAAATFIAAEGPTPQKTPPPGPASAAPGSPPPAVRPRPAQLLLGNRQARSCAVLPIGRFRRRGRRAELEEGLRGWLRAAIGRPLGGGGAVRAEALELPEGVGATAGLGAGSGGGVAQEELARGVGGAGGTGASARGGGTREAAIGAAGPQGSLRSARQGPVAPALLQVSRRGLHRLWTVFRKGGHPGLE